VDNKRSIAAADSASHHMGRTQARVAIIAQGFALRPRMLIGQFSNTRILVCRAMQGYGKSVVLAQNWQAFYEQGKLSVWLRLRDQFDTEASFVRTIWDQLQWQIGDHDIPAPVNPTQLEAILWDQPQLWRPILICIDGVECHAQVLRQLEDLILTTPNHVQFIIAAGTQRGFSRLAAAPDTHCLHTHDLALTIDELEDLKHNTLTAPLSISAKEMLDKTEGWPYLCQLFFHTEYPDLKASLWPEATCFFAEEIIARLSVRHRQFIERASLIDPISAESFDYTFKTKDAAAMIQDINRDHLLFGIIQGAPGLYKLHPALREYLELRYLTQNSRAKSYSLKRGAFWHWHKREFKQTIDLALRAGDFRWARGLSEDIILDLALRQGEIETLGSWLSQFPTEELNKHPIVNLGYAWTLYFSQQAKQADEILSTLLDDGNSRVSAASDYGWPQLVRAVGMATHDRLSLSEELCTDWIARYGDANTVGKATALTCLSVIAASQYRFDEMEPLLERAHVANSLARQRYAFGWYYVAKILAANGRGEMRLVQGTIEQARVDSNVQEKRTSFSSQMLAIMEIESLYEQGGLEMSPGQISTHLEFAAAYAITDVALRVYRTVAKVYQKRGNNKDAITILKQMLGKAEQRELPRLVAMLELELCEMDVCSGKDHTIRLRFIQAHPALSGPEARPLRSHLSLIQAMAALNSGKHALAAQHAKTAAQTARLIGASQLHVRALLCQAAANAVAGQDQLATKLILNAQNMMEYLGCYQTGFDMRDQLNILMNKSRADCGEIQFRPFSQKPILTSPAALKPRAHKVTLLSKKQIQVLRHASEGLSNKQIAARLMVSESTIKWHMQNIFKGLKSSNRVQAIQEAKRAQLI